ncbi:hypothetical protein [Herbiconiux ginsengi]|uniref:hypothetical protein n=1 Tax=Herbiconiux ginsengi TaxID=381665 RepID=UPI000B8A32E5|nr:hypothetical protein [Herbiconiux ginsengi]
MSAEQLIAAPRDLRKTRPHVAKLSAASSDIVTIVTASTPAQLSAESVNPTHHSHVHNHYHSRMGGRQIAMYSSVILLAGAATTLVTIAATRF